MDLKKNWMAVPYLPSSLRENLSLSILEILHSDKYDNNPKWLNKYSYAPRQRRQKKVFIPHKYRGLQQFSRVEYSTQIYRIDIRGAKEYLKVLAAELSIQPHLGINYLQQRDQ